MEAMRYGIAIDGRDGTYRFRRLLIARKALRNLQLSPEEPAAVLSRVDPDGTFHVLAERHFEGEESRGTEGEK